jgi:hypothetical protein
MPRKILRRAADGCGIDVFKIKGMGGYDMRREEFLPDIGNLDTFEAMCKRERSYCPVSKEEKGIDKKNSFCHWCRVSYYRGVEEVKGAVLGKLFTR